VSLLREITPIENGDDPFSGNPFPRVWTQGQGESDTRSITVAAASLMVQSVRTAEQGVALLEKVRSQDSDAVGNRNIDLELMTGYAALNRHTLALDRADALAKLEPLSRCIFDEQIRSRVALGRYREAEEIARLRLAAQSKDIDAMNMLSQILIAQGQYAAAFDITKAIIADPRYLHTLGTLYAEMGKTKEARETFLLSMSASNLEEPTGNLWYSFGRIAEQYGEREIALQDYARVKAPSDRSMCPSRRTVSRSAVLQF
jgi:tetratricopeptide (TPR) repeat protein